MKNILITGASKGIGRAIAEKIADENTTLYLHGRDRQSLTKTSELVASSGATVNELIYDLSDVAETNKLADAVDCDTLDVLINNAGMTVTKEFEKISHQEWQKIFDVNVTAPFLLIQKLLPKIPKGGSIVNMLSIASHKGFPGWSAYCMTKFALEGFVQSIREELRSKEIRVINIYPAATETDIWNDVPGESDFEKMLSSDDVAKAVVNALEQPQAAVMEDIIIRSIYGSR